MAAALDDLMWTSRPVLVFAPKADTPAAVEQIRRFSTAAAALRERDMRVVIVTGDATAAALDGGAGASALDARALRKRFGVARDDFAVILIGKDGGEKLRSKAPVEADRLTDLVDTMPMRRREAR